MGDLEELEALADQLVRSAERQQKREEQITTSELPDYIVESGRAGQRKIAAGRYGPLPDAPGGTDSELLETGEGVDTSRLEARVTEAQDLLADPNTPDNVRDHAQRLVDNATQDQGSNLFMDILGGLSVPANFISSATVEFGQLFGSFEGVGESDSASFGDLFAQAHGDNAVTPTDLTNTILPDMGFTLPEWTPLIGDYRFEWNDPLNIIAEVALDPLTYLTGGVGKFKDVSKIGIKNLSDDALRQVAENSGDDALAATVRSYITETDSVVKSGLEAKLTREFDKLAPNVKYARYDGVKVESFTDLRPRDQVAEIERRGRDLVNQGYLTREQVAGDVTALMRDGLKGFLATGTDNALYGISSKRGIRLPFAGTFDTRLNYRPITNVRAAGRRKLIKAAATEEDKFTSKAIMFVGAGLSGSKRRSLFRAAADGTLSDVVRSQNIQRLAKMNAARGQTRGFQHEHETARWAQRKASEEGGTALTTRELVTDLRLLEPGFDSEARDIAEYVGDLTHTKVSAWLRDRGYTFEDLNDPQKAGRIIREFEETTNISGKLEVQIPRRVDGKVVKNKNGDVELYIPSRNVGGVDTPLTIDHPEVLQNIYLRRVADISQNSNFHADMDFMVNQRAILGDQAIRPEDLLSHESFAKLSGYRAAIDGMLDYMPENVFELDESAANRFARDVRRADPVFKYHDEMVNILDEFEYKAMALAGKVDESLPMSEQVASYIDFEEPQLDRVARLMFSSLDDGDAVEMAGKLSVALDDAVVALREYVDSPSGFHPIDPQELEDTLDRVLAGLVDGETGFDDLFGALNDPAKSKAYIFEQMGDTAGMSKTDIRREFLEIKDEMQGEMREVLQEGLDRVVAVQQGWSNVARIIDDPDFAGELLAQRVVRREEISRNIDAVSRVLGDPTIHPNQIGKILNTDLPVLLNKLDAMDIEARDEVLATIAELRDATQTGMHMKARMARLNAAITSENFASISTRKATDPADLLDGTLDRTKPFDDLVDYLRGDTDLSGDELHKLWKKTRKRSDRAFEDGKWVIEPADWAEWYTRTAHYAARQGLGESTPIFVNRSTTLVGEQANEVLRAVMDQFDSEEFHRYFKLADTFMNLWIKPQLLLRPGFSVRNMQSAMFTNIMHGGVGLEDLREYANVEDLVREAYSDDVARSALGQSATWDEVEKVVGKEALQYYKEAKDLGLDQATMFQKMDGRILSTESGVIGETKWQRVKLVAKAKRESHGRVRAAFAGWQQGTAELAKSFDATTSAATRSGLAPKTVARTLKRRLRVRKGLERRIDLIPTVEGFARESLYVSLRKRGYTADAALDKVFALHLDYTDLTFAERNIKTFLPFWVWATRSAAYGAHVLATDPTKFRLVTETYRRTQMENDPNFTPPWLINDTAVGIPGTDWRFRSPGGHETELFNRAGDILGPDGFGKDVPVTSRIWAGSNRVWMTWTDDSPLWDMAASLLASKNSLERGHSDREVLLPLGDVPIVREIYDLFGGSFVRQDEDGTYWGDKALMDTVNAMVPVIRTAGSATASKTPDGQAERSRFVTGLSLLGVSFYRIGPREQQQGINVLVGDADSRLEFELRKAGVLKDDQDF